MDTNPILNELQGLSPGAQQALMQAHVAASAPPNINAGAQAPKIDPATRQATAGLQAPGAPPPPMMGAPMAAPPNPTSILGAPSAPHVTQMSPMQEQTHNDESERSRLLSTGSGIHQIQNPVLRGLAGVANTIGSIAAPGLMREIPGTEEHHEQLLGRANKNLTGDVDFGQKEAQTANLGAITAHENQETAGLPTSQADAHNTALANEANLKSEADTRGKPKDAWKELTGYTGPKGEPLEINEGTGETRPANAPAGSHVTSPKETTPQQQTFDSLIKQGMTPMQAYEKIREKPGGTTVNQGTWSLDEDSTTGKPVLFNSKNGETKAAPAGIAKTGTFAKNEAKTASEKAALEYANDYASRSLHTGPGDEALMEKFFELAKPSTGFRMSQPQIDMLKNAQSWMGGLEAHLRHAASGTWFSDEQRQQIAATMQDLAKAKGLGTSPENAEKGANKEGDTKQNSAGDKVVFRGGKWTAQ